VEIQYKIMFYLQQNAQNPITVTVTEKQMTTSSLFLFEFINAAGKFYTMAYDSASLNRYNRFCITTTGSNADPTQGQIYLSLIGQYTYNIYEDPSGSLSPLGLNNCETGIMTVTTGSTPILAYTGSTTNFIAYNG
jgi:hypothetical protein